MFEEGNDMDLSKLYPPIEFPVSRGTPMISSQVKWDHRTDHFVVQYDKKVPLSEKIYGINISEPEFEFMCGHAIDGKI